MIRSTRRARLLGAFVIAGVLGASVVVPAGASAAAAVTADAPVPDPDAPTPRDTMGEFSADAYTAQAAALPPALQAAIAADLGDTPADYLASADAAANAVEVVDSLSAAGVDVLGSRLDGTELVVNVGSDADAAAVEAANAEPELGAPAPFAADEHDFRFLADLVGGQGYYSQDSRYLHLCSVAFNGVDRTSRQNQFLTAGHCRVEGTIDAGRVRELVQNRPGADPTVQGAVLGQPLDSTFALGDQLDSGLIATDAAWTPQPKVGTWNSNSGPVTAGAQQTVRDYSRAVVGQSICKSGRTSGWTCGTVQYVDQIVNVRDEHGDIEQVNSIISTMCALPGDSGGAVVSGGYAIGVLSNGTFASCSDSGKFTGTFPMTAPAGRGSVLGSQPEWELAVPVATPVVVSPVLASPGAGAALAVGERMTGSVPGATSRYSVQIVVDGTHSTTAAVQSDGSWSADVAAGLAPGAHTFTATASYGSGTSVSASVTGAFQLVAIDRIQGPDRFAVAVAVAERQFPLDATAPVVYVATGANYPDALSAGPAAVAEDGPLLLVTRDAIPAAVAEKIARLHPERIVIAGGPNSVSAAVADELAGLVAGVEVERRTGADRYEASREIVDAAFGASGHAYVATGGTFPDALSAGGAAGSKGQPVVLVNGPAATVDDPTLALFQRHGTGSLTVVGGVNSVSTAVENALRAGIPAPRSVDRVAGADQFAASVSLNRSAFSAAGTVYLATGLNFPDALAGGVLAGKTDAPLYVVPGDCVPRDVLTEVGRLNATQVVLLGGPNSLSPAVAALAPCAW